MSSIARLIRQTMTIARRDFVATVFTPTFLLFLFAPLMMVGFGAIGGVGAASISKSGDDKARIVWTDIVDGAPLLKGAIVSP